EPAPEPMISCRRAWLLAAFLLVSAACATAPRSAPPRGLFPPDPREEMTGPFPDSVARGWAALGRDDPAAALREFEAARAEGAERVGTVGWIEAPVPLGRFEPALASCEDALVSGEATVPLLVACGEANGRGGKPPAGY